MKTILHILKVYKGDQPLLNDIFSAGGSAFRNIVCYLSGEDDGSNGATSIVDSIIYLGLKPAKVKWSNLQTIRAVTHIINREKVDIIDCQFWRTMPIGALAGVLSKRKPKVVGVFHGVRGERINLRKKLLFIATFQAMDKVVSVSDAGIIDIAKGFWGLDSEKLVPIPNGLDFALFIGTESGNKEQLFGSLMKDKRIFITVSRLAEKKNLLRLLIAIKAVLGQHNNLGLVIVGDGPEEKKLKAYVADNGLSQHVVFLGHRADIPLLMKSADVYAIPSLREGLPRTLLEAMASGCPVLASSINGIEEVVQAPEQGCLVNPEDLAAIKAALVDFMEKDDSELRAMGRAAKFYVTEKHDNTVMKKKYAELFSALA